MIEFNAEKHEYTLEGKKLISVTQLLQKHGIAPSYDFVDHELLQTASERGTIIHAEVEDWVKNRTKGFTVEADLIIHELYKLGIEGECEVKVHNDIIAGTADYMSDDYLIDFKTGNAKHMYAWSWQVALYEYLSGRSFVHKEIWWVHNEKLEILPCQSIAIENMKALVEAEREGKKWTPEVDVNPDTLSDLYAIELETAKLKAKIKELEAQEKQLKIDVLQAMEEKNMKSMSYENMAITYVAPSIRKSLDEEKLQSVVADLTPFYKESKINASLRFKINIK